MKPRDYQLEAEASIYTYFANNSGNPLLAMPTGTGKSVVIALFLRGIYQRFANQRVMVLTHVKELISQNYRKLLTMWPSAPAGVYSAGLDRRDVHFPITFAGVASVAKRAGLFGRVDLLLIDEAHLVGPNEETMYIGLINELRKVNPHLKVIGLTATAWRLGHGKLHEKHPIFTDVCFDITGLHAFNRLLAEGYLCPLVPKKTAAVLDVDGVHMRGGEFISKELQAAVDKHEISYAALQEACQLAADRKSWLLFCAGVEHSIHVAAMLTSLGVPCKAVHSKLSDKERDAILADWFAGRLRAVANNNVLTTGIDHPALDCIVMLRPTASVILWVQMLGRGTRPLYAPGYDLDTADGRLAAIQASEKQDCLVLDFAGNTKRLGPINDPVVPRRKGEKAGEAPVKLCPACATYNHASVRHCAFCGSEFPSYGPKVQDRASTEDLIKPSMPVIELFKVDYVTYSEHHKAGKPPSLKASYFCGLRMFQEYVGFEHPDQFSRTRARRWWNDRCPTTPLKLADGATIEQAVFNVPKTTAEALELAPKVRPPSHLRVRVDQRYPEIIAACFDGTAFGTTTAGPLPDVGVDRPPPPAPPRIMPPGAPDRLSFDDLDDDIPF